PPPIDDDQTASVGETRYLEGAAQGVDRRAQVRAGSLRVRFGPEQLDRFVPAQPIAGPGENRLEQLARLPASPDLFGQDSAIERSLKETEHLHLEDRPVPSELRRPGRAECSQWRKVSLEILDDELKDALEPFDIAQ